MPVKRKPRFRKKRTFRRKKKAIVYRNPWPPSARYKFRFSEYGNLTSATNASDVSTFYLNSLYDPHASFGADQPRYFDQLCGLRLYNRYLVEKVDVKITFINKSTTKDALCGFKIQSNSTSADASTSDGLLLLNEFPNGKCRTLLPSPDGGSRTTFKIVGKELWSIVTASRAMYNTDPAQFSGTYAADPADIVYLYIYGADNPQDVDGCSIDWYVDITFYARLYDAGRNVAQS